MAIPSRASRPGTYFVTTATYNPRRLFQSSANAELFLETLQHYRGLGHYKLHAFVVMPDHVHFVITLTEDRGISAGDFAPGFKRLLRKRLISQTWEWQRGCFDRLLRSGEDLHNKWLYLEQNPVRAGLVENVLDCPYYLGSIAEQGSWQLPLQKKATGQ